MTDYEQFVADLIATGRAVEDGDCLRWTGACISGHPAMAHGTSRGVMVRRVLWEKKHGPIPPGKILRCTCSTPRCIELQHCELSTYQKVAQQLGAIGVMSGPVRSANIARAHRERHPKTRLTQQQAREIFDSDELGKVLAARYGVSEAHISRIRLGKVRREYGGNVWQGLGA